MLLIFYYVKNVSSNCFTMAFLCPEIQEGPLTLRGERGRCRNIKGDLQIFGSFPNQGYAYFSSECDFLVGLGKPKLCTKFEVASFSHCVNIDGNPQILGSTPSAGPCLPFLLRVVLYGLWQTLDACQI